MGFGNESAIEVRFCEKCRAACEVNASTSTVDRQDLK